MQDFCKKRLFQLDDIHYLNCAYMSPLSVAVEEAGIEGMRRKRIPSALTAGHFFEHCTQIRERFQRLIGAPAPETIAVLPSVSYGMAIIASNTVARAGQKVVVAGAQMPSNVFAWHRFCEERGARLCTVPQPESLADRGLRWNERVLEAIDSQTVLVVLEHVHWLDGTLFDMEAISRRAREVGAALVIDGTQSLGAVPFNLGSVPADAVFAAGYKWLLGPYSIAVGYFGPRYLEGRPLEEPWLNRRNSHDFPNLIQYQREYQPGAIRYDVGESSNFILAPMLATALGQLLEWGTDSIARYCATLTRFIATEARELGFGSIDEAQRGPHYLGLTVPEGLKAADIQEALRRAKVIVSIRGSFLRVTPNVYNDLGDAEALIGVLRQLRR
jgi:selenocysteine lyase/cysteine desulfurase